ncbi:MAG TPA: hypothetical protein VGL62_08870 [Vicinamibacterales bacterium]|jgi:hypothetical protein
MTETTPPSLNPETRDQMKRWLDTWAWVGPLLEKERWDRILAMTDEEANRSVARLLELWQRDWPTDEGQELLLHQRVFARGRRLSDR